MRGRGGVGEALESKQWTLQRKQGSSDKKKESEFQGHKFQCLAIACKQHEATCFAAGQGVGLDSRGILQVLLVLVI